jgi:hypothetical protein
MEDVIATSVEAAKLKLNYMMDSLSNFRGCFFDARLNLNEFHLDSLLKFQEMFFINSLETGEEGKFFNH